MVAAKKTDRFEGRACFVHARVWTSVSFSF
jgi:hypothetical protein